MISKEKKQVIVADLVEILSKTTGLYLVDYQGMTVADAEEFRAKLREEDHGFKVAKNTLIKRAIDEVGGFEFKDGDLTGMSGLALGFSDPVAPSKVLKDFIDKHKKPVFKAAIIEGQYYDSSKLETITKLPSREDMIAGIIGSISAPISGIQSALDDAPRGLVNILNSVTRDLASVIEEVAKKKNAA